MLCHWKLMKRLDTVSRSDSLQRPKRRLDLPKRTQLCSSFDPVSLLRYCYSLYQRPSSHLPRLRVLSRREKASVNSSQRR
jgi:hypothetical protein